MVSEGYGSLREPILYSALRARAFARMGAASDCTQAVALLERLEPVFPASWVLVLAYEGRCVFPAPRGEQGSAAFSFGCQKSGRKNLIDIVYFLSSRYRPGPPRSWEGAWTKWRRVGSPTVLHPACVKSPYIIVPRQGHTFPNHEISKMAKSGRVVVRLTHEYRICLSSL